jgi:hypothetical protein
MYRISISILIIGIIFISGCRDKHNNSENNQNESTAGNFKKSIDEFYFVGLIGENPGIYKFISKTQKPGKSDISITKFWSKKNEKVIKLSYSPDKKSLFFLTAEDIGKKATLPYINDIRLYRISQDSSKAVFIKKIGTGLQVFTVWGQDKSFRIILSSFDRNSADFVIQQTSAFSGVGNLLNSNTKKFNIFKDGYPQIEEKTGITSSPGSRYSIFSIDSTLTSIFLQSNSDGKVRLITSTDKKLNQVDWSSDEKYLIFSTAIGPQRNKSAGTGNSNTSKLYIYSIENNKITKALDVNEMKNFFITGDLLIFDKGIQKNSNIQITNYKTLKPFYSIRLKGGSGLKNIF